MGGKAGKVPVSTNTSIKREVQTRPDGTQVTTITTTTVQKYSDGSESTSTDVKTQTEKSNADHKVNGSSQGASGNPKPTGSRKSVAGGSQPKESQEVPINNGKTDEKFMQEALRAHNDLRARHSSPPLTLDAGLSNSAQEWANKIAARKKMEHSTTDLGENVYWSTKTSIDGNVPVENWYSEIKTFDFKKMKPQSGTGHFTQVIWKSSQRMGIAKAVHPQAGTFVVAQYEPPGNFIGQYEANISPAK